MRKTGVVVLAGAVAMVAAAAWLLVPGEVRIDHTDRALVARGEPLYAQHCASCHGARLEGQPDWQSRNAQGRLPAPPHDDSGHTWHHDDALLFEVTKYGIAKHAPPGYQSDMPAFGDRMSDAEIIATLAFIKSRWTDETHGKRSQAGMN
jgi:mono/diheme cytochrome c family protein